jgi:hypothetical protein
MTLPLEVLMEGLNRLGEYMECGQEMC